MKSSSGAIGRGGGGVVGASVVGSGLTTAGSAILSVVGSGGAVVGAAVMGSVVTGAEVDGRGLRGTSSAEDFETFSNFLKRHLFSRTLKKYGNE